MPSPHVALATLGFLVALAVTLVAAAVFADRLDRVGVRLGGGFPRRVPIYLEGRVLAIIALASMSHGATSSLASAIGCADDELQGRCRRCAVEDSPVRSGSSYTLAARGMPCATARPWVVKLTHQTAAGATGKTFKGPSGFTCRSFSTSLLGRQARVLGRVHEGAAQPPVLRVGPQGLGSAARSSRVAPQPSGFIVRTPTPPSAGVPLARRRRRAIRPVRSSRRPHLRSRRASAQRVACRGRTAPDPPATGTDAEAGCGIAQAVGKPAPARRRRSHRRCPGVEARGRVRSSPLAETPNTAVALRAARVRNATAPIVGRLLDEERLCAENPFGSRQRWTYSWEPPSVLLGRHAPTTRGLRPPPQLAPPRGHVYRRRRATASDHVWSTPPPIATGRTAAPSARRSSDAPTLAAAGHGRTSSAQRPRKPSTAAFHSSRWLTVQPCGASFSTTSSLLGM